MKDNSFSVAEAAEQVGTSVSSVRRWVAEFAPHFSPGANPDKGVFRRLSAQDIQVLQEIARLKTDSLPLSTISERLSGIVFQAPIVESPQAAQEGQGEAQGALVVVVEVLRSVETRLQALEQKTDSSLQALETRVIPLEAQRGRLDVVWVAVSTFIAGLLLGLAVWWFQ